MVGRKVAIRQSICSKAKLETQHGFNNRDESASQTSITFPSVSNPGGEYNSAGTLECKMPLIYQKSPTIW